MIQNSDGLQIIQNPYMEVAEYKSLPDAEQYKNLKAIVLRSTMFHSSGLYISNGKKWKKV
jgi:hypothetical protein